MPLNPWFGALFSSVSNNLSHQSSAETTLDSDRHLFCPIWRAILLRTLSIDYMLVCEEGVC